MRTHEDRFSSPCKPQDFTLKETDDTMFIDPLYLILMLPALAFAMWASWRTRSAFNKYSRQGTMNGLTGAQAAQRLLDRAGIRDVDVVPTQGYLSDHYNPQTKTLAWSEQVYG